MTGIVISVINEGENNIIYMVISIYVYDFYMSIYTVVYVYVYIYDIT